MNKGLVLGIAAVLAVLSFVWMANPTIQQFSWYYVGPFLFLLAGVWLGTEYQKASTPQSLKAA